MHLSREESGDENIKRSVSSKIIPLVVTVKILSFHLHCKRIIHNNLIPRFADPSLFIVISLPVLRNFMDNYV